MENLTSTFLKISKAITGNIDLDATLTIIVESTMEYLTSVGGAIFLVNKQKKTVEAKKIATSKIGEFILQALSRDFDSLWTSYDRPENRIGLCVKSKQVQVGDSVADFISPTVSNSLAKLIQRIGRIKSLVAIPAIIGGEVVGVLLLGFEEEKGVIPKNMEAIQIFTDQVAIAINNALKYEELKKRYELEKETTALLSHELKTPIAITNNSAQILKALIQELPGKHDAKLVEKFEKNQKEIHDGLLRMNSICSSIFNFREIENSVPTGNQNIDLKRLLDQMIRLYQTRAERKGLKFKSILRISKNEEFMGKAIQFEQVVSTILDNAVKYTEHGNIELKISISPKTLKAEISDTGPGIPKKEREAIFERFNRLSQGDKTVQGLGLGLYMAKKITDELKGKIQIAENSKAKSGTRFTIKIPR